MKFLFYFIFALSGAAVQADSLSSCKTNSDKCTFSVFPHSNFEHLLETYEPIVEDLSLILDTQVKLIIARSLSDFGAKLKQSAFDVILVGPGQYVIYAEPSGYESIAKREGKMKLGLYARKDSGISSYQDLKGHKIGRKFLYSTSRFAGDILLEKNNVNVKEHVSIAYDNQQACAYGMAIKQVDACFLSEANLQVISAQYANTELVLIDDLLAVPNSVYAVHSSLDEGLKQKIKHYLVDRIGFEEAQQSDFDGFRQRMVQAIK